MTTDEWSEHVTMPMSKAREAELNRALKETPTQFHAQIWAKRYRICAVCCKPISAFSWKLNMCESCQRDHNIMVEAELDVQTKGAEG
jgi:hypothetical protein